VKFQLETVSPAGAVAVNGTTEPCCTDRNGTDKVRSCAAVAATQAGLLGGEHDVTVVVVVPPFELSPT
jgi:hypothetical protein